MTNEEALQKQKEQIIEVLKEVRAREPWASSEYGRITALDEAIKEVEQLGDNSVPVAE